MSELTNEPAPAQTEQAPEQVPASEPVPPNPVEKLLRIDRMPHIWCPGCGIGTSVNCFARALDKIKIPYDDLAIISGIGCTGRVAGYLNLDSVHTTHGRAIPFATGLKLAAPKMKVVVYSGDGDLIAIGGNHFIHAARRNADITVICINNFTYAMTGGQVGPTTPTGAVATTTPFGNFERPFNLVHLAESSGAVYVARWTTYHVRQATKAIAEALNKEGFAFVEILAPCPTLYSRRNRLGDGLAMQKFFKKAAVKKDGADTANAGVGFQEGFLVGKFVDRDRPLWREQHDEVMKQRLGAKFVPYKAPGEE